VSTPLADGIGFCVRSFDLADLRGKTWDGERQQQEQNHEPAEPCVPHTLSHLLFLS